MKMKNVLVFVAVVGLIATAGKAAQDTGEKFRPNELSLDLFGTFANQDRFGNKTDHGGGGLGLNYYFTRYVGIGADSYVEEWKAPYRVNGSVLLRYPIPGAIGLAPYIFGGGGRQMKYATQWTLHGGGGLEVRLNPHTGIFGDIRRVFSEMASSLDYTLVRAGLRLSF